MSKQDSLLRHKIIIQKLRNQPSSFEEIQNKLQSEADLLDADNLVTSLRTFQRDLLDIASFYGIEIKYNRSKKVYFIENDSEDKYSERMFEALDVFQALNVNQSFSAYIQFDTRKPEGTEHLSGILYAIQNKFQIQFRYQKFQEKEEEIRTVEPYLLKEFRKRWYVFAYDLKHKEFRTFGLDRLSALNISSNKFQFPQKINLKEYFKDCFGIVGPNEGEVQDILLKFTSHQGNYIKTMPLHESQQIIQETPDEMLVKLKLIPTYDFLMEILYYGEFVQVLEPKHLADEVKGRFQKAVKLYGSQK